MAPTPSDLRSKTDLLADWIAAAERIVVFTGAGISTESGIADYRSKGGLWDRFQPVTIQEFLASEEKRELYWKRKHEMFLAMRDAKPNEGHRAIARLERRGKLKGIITQNIDGFHGMAGNSPDRILELHGTNREVICLSCQKHLPWQGVCERLERGEKAPRCSECGGLLKPNTISFGQALDSQVLAQSVACAEDCDLLLAVGSTLVVEPAASIPRIAKERGARLVIITLSETPLDAFADLKIVAKVGEVLSRAVKEVPRGR